MRVFYCTSLVLILVLASVLTAPSFSADLSMAARVKSPPPVVLPDGSSMSVNGTESYTGTLRIYIVEPTSRWRDSHNHKFDFGFLDFALQESVSVDSGTVWSQTVVWDPATAGFSGVVESNIMAIAVMFSSQSYQADAYPGNGFWFNAHNVEAAAGATPGNPGRNVANESFTHTVFLEEATAHY